jgi:hypothetical protein
MVAFDTATARQHRLSESAGNAGTEKIPSAY